MKLIFAPSGKRMIPYPPVGIAVLAGALNDGCSERADLVDLEMAVWGENQRTASVPIYSAGLNAPKILRGERTHEDVSFQERLYALSRIVPGEDVGISVMGFEQVASALLLATACLERGSRVVMGGQFWSAKSAEETLLALKHPQATIVVGDGWDAIRSWKTLPNVIPPNGFSLRDGSVRQGDAIERVSRPPEPDYSSLDWQQYIDYAEGVFNDARPIRRAHLYVWDKLCPYKCNFCRVSSGSKAQLTPPDGLRTSLQRLLGFGVTQLNFMTNELNPSLSYMRRLVETLKPDLLGRTDLGWFTYLRPDSMELEDLLDLRAIGCRLVRYGVETGSQRLSDRMQKEYLIPTVEKVLRDAAQADIMNHVNFLVGYPGETQEDVQDTLDFIERNRETIHSVRINPFYLPPGSKLALNPEKYGLRLIAFKRGYWDFELSDGTRTSSGVIQERIEQITELLLELDIGFAATLPFETLNQLTRFASRDEALAAMRLSHAYMWETASPDELKALSGGYKMKADWKSTIYQRGRNYSMTVCTD